MTKKNIAVICQKDNLWLLYTCNNLFKRQKINTDFNLIGFWNCEKKKFKNKRGTWKWYLQTFGFDNFLKLASFTIIFKGSLILRSILSGYKNSFKKLCRANNIKYYKTTNPNSQEFINWIKKNEIDILIVMVDHILKKDVLDATKICSINKHSGLLPSNKGLFPYFWAQLKNETQGISFHVMNEKIDEGELIYQEKVENDRLIKSMISFYFYTYKNYGEMLIKTLLNLENKTLPDPLTDKASYQSFPTTKDYKNFCSTGGKIIRWSDFFLLLKLR